MSCRRRREARRRLRRRYVLSWGILKWPSLGEFGWPPGGLCSTLRVNGQIVAVHAGMWSRDTLHYWFPAYDVEFSKFSVGNLLLLRMARALPAYGVRTIDLGKGGEQYKERLMSGRMQLYEGCVELPSLLTCVRRLRRAAKLRAAGGGLGAPLHLPLRAIRRIERTRKFN